MVKVLHRFLVVLVAFAIVGGMTARSSEYGMVAVGMPCDMMMPAPAADGHATPMAPCKTMTGDCLKQIGCVADIALPARFASLEVVTHRTSVDYWSAWSNHAGLVREPEPLPPRTT